MLATIVINTATNGWLVQFQSAEGGTDSRVYAFKDRKLMLNRVESWTEMEIDDARNDTD